MDTSDAPASAKSSPQINTYHCICTTLLLATTHILSSLPHRAEPALDKAIILRLPPVPRSDVDEDNDDSAPVASTQDVNVGYSVLLSTTQDRKPVIIRREDGFEKRTLLRCGRCRLVVGYKLDDAQSSAEEGNRERGATVVFLLPGGLVSSDDMNMGKVPEEVEWVGLKNS